MELGLLLEMTTSDAGDRVAVTDVDGSAMTRSELAADARRAAARFLAAGATQIGYLTTNGRALPVALFGAALAGLPFVPFNYRLSDEQLTEELHREPGLLVITDPKGEQRVHDLGIERTMLTSEVLAPGSEAEDVDLPYVDPDGVAVILYTSGTTSTPKAALLRHRHLTSYVINTVEFGDADTSEAILVSVPPYHIAGVSTILSNLYRGRRIVYLDPFDPHRWLELVKTEGVTNTMVVPTMLARIIEVLGDQEADVPTLRSIAYGGAKMPAPIIEKALELFPHVDFTNAYGLTETSSTITVLGPDEHRAAIASDDPSVRARLASAGRAVPGIEMKVVDPMGNTCACRESGMVMVRGEQVAGEYSGKSMLDADGWFITRDTGYLDEEDYLFIEGRVDDTIIRGGENIAPEEIEAVLVRHPGVRACAVVGVPDPEWGQRIAAAVVLTDSTVSTDDLQAWTREHLRGSKTPELIEIRDSLPYTETGKLLRREVLRFFTSDVS